MAMVRCTLSRVVYICPIFGAVLYQVDKNKTPSIGTSAVVLLRSRDRFPHRFLSGHVDGDMEILERLGTGHDEGLGPT